MRAPLKLSRRRLAAVAAARAGVGTRFRPQGRAPGLGLDCVGVALLAMAGAGIPAPVLPAYTLGGDHRELLAAACRGLGLRHVPPGRPGDFIVFSLAEGHVHLAVLSEAGIIHAHAGLGRVVEGPVPDDWPVLAQLKLPVR